MKYLKKFESVQIDEENIKICCDNLGIFDYEINEDGSIDVNDSVDISDVFLTSFSKGSTDEDVIGVVFNEIHGFFNCSGNYLDTLEGWCPRKVYGNFICNNNDILSLKGCPEYIFGDFNISYNKIENIDYFPNLIDGDFSIQSNKLTNITGMSNISGNITVSDNSLESLNGSPHTINGRFKCLNCDLTSLEGGPKEVDLLYDCSHNPLTTLKGCVDTKRLCVNNCSLTNLKYMPEGLEYADFNRNFITSLEGIKEVKDTIILANNQIREFDYLPTGDDTKLDLLANPINETFRFKTIYDAKVFKQYKVITDNKVKLKNLKYFTSVFNDKYKEVKPHTIDNIKGEGYEIID